jgi:hypothetical protein
MNLRKEALTAKLVESVLYTRKTAVWPKNRVQVDTRPQIPSLVWV